MSFWSTQTLHKRSVDEELISPFNSSNIKHCSYELALGGEYYSTENQNNVKKSIRWKRQISIPAGQFALLLTEEKVRVPNDAIGFISIKAGIKFKGLINVSGFHMDPGFDGKIIFAVYNAGSQSITLTRGEPYFLLWFSDLDEATPDLYDRNNDKGITAEHIYSIQGDVASPAALDKRITKIENIGRIALWVAGVFATLVGAIISGILPKVLELWLNK